MNAKTIAIALIAAAALGGQGAGATGAVGRKPPPLLSSFDDLDQAGIGRGYQPAAKATSEEEPATAPRDLSFFDRIRYESCQRDAVAMPTELGVRNALSLCAKKFGR
jgi:hypothetical protein